jgi:hypothetical protein
MAPQHVERPAAAVTANGSRKVDHAGRRDDHLDSNGSVQNQHRCERTLRYALDNPGGLHPWERDFLNKFCGWHKPFTAKQRAVIDAIAVKARLYRAYANDIVALTEAKGACHSRETVEPSPEAVETPSPAVVVLNSTVALPLRQIPPPGVRERNAAYPCLVHISDKLRVIECRDGIQWIRQRFDGNGWRNVGYHRDRNVLIQRCGSMSASALVALQGLPKFHLGRDVPPYQRSESLSPTAKTKLAGVAAHDWRLHRASVRPETPMASCKGARR